MHMDRNQKFKTMIEDFLSDLRPGAKLEIPNVGRLEYLTRRKLIYFRFRDGVTTLWELPDPHESSITGIIQEYLVKLLS
jgi:hypothetical protein